MQTYFFYVQVNPETVRPQILARSQDDAMVGYVFQRPHSDPDFPLPPAFKQQPRWGLADDTVIDQVGTLLLIWPKCPRRIGHWPEAARHRWPKRRRVVGGLAYPKNSENRHKFAQM